MGISSGSCSSSRDLLIDQMPIRPKGPMPPKVPIPKHRHAIPSGPWPWQDLSLAREPPQQTMAPVDPIDAAYQTQEVEKWNGYPQTQFPNWLPDQCKNSKISEVSSKNISTIYIADVDCKGEFHNRKSRNEMKIWEEMQPRYEENRVRCLFIDQMSDRVLKMIGTRYTVEPFFFSSSINWIPSRYQENVDPKVGDHITIVLPFIRAIQDLTEPQKESQASEDNDERTYNESHAIDTQTPLLLHSKHILITDQLAIHLVRRPNLESSTMISYHQERDWLTTPAHYLHERLINAGNSVYWQNIFKWSPDPTFVLLAIMWYPLYAWDEALELLSAHIIYLEDLVIKTNSMRLIRQLHKIRGHLLHYTSLLANYRKSLEFLLATPNPAMDGPGVRDEIRQKSENTMDKECKNLLSEIDRLKELIEAQQRRLKNGISLEFATVNIKDMQATMKDSTAMVRISYLTALFLPSTFVATCFGMNINELVPGTAGNTVHVVLVAIGFTCFTIWLIFAAQRRESMMSGLKWPMRYLPNRVQLWPAKLKGKGVPPGDDIV